jgi:MFS family permease
VSAPDRHLDPARVRRIQTDSGAASIEPPGTSSGSSSGRSSGSSGDSPGGDSEVGGAYSRYVLFVLVLVYVLNFLDRQVITILAEDIKADLGISDAEIGFLYGTAFAVFYAIFGIPLGRLADVWTRRNLISMGLAFWSAMTALSGLARNFGQLAVARVGVGVGEASATPAAFSMLADSFPARIRATILAIYSSGIYIGAGLGLLIGGQVVERWNLAYADGGAPFGLAGWQAAYMIVGLPGLLLAIWVRTLREPVRGAADGILTAPEPHPFQQFWIELRSVLPPLTLWHLWRSGAGVRGLTVNLAGALVIALCAWGLIQVTGNRAQWIALGIGLYAAFSWMGALRLRDPASAALIFGTPSLRYLVLGLSFCAFTGYGIGGWTPIFFMRIHEQSSASVGSIVGITAAIAGVIGVTGGGWLADRLRATSPVGRIYVALLTTTVPIPLALWMLTTENLTLAYILNFPLSIFAATWIGVGASTVQDLVLPRMRAVASAFYLLVITFIGLALGPYMIGQLSDALGDLGLAMRWALVANAAALTLLLLCMRHLARDEASVIERARAAGESIPKR